MESRGYSCHPTAEVSSEAKVGPGTKVWKNAQIREGVSIGANCTVSKDVYVDKGVTIGNNCKIENGVSVFNGVTIDDEVFVGPNATFTNDFRPRALSGDWVVTPTRVERGASIGANATIVCGVTIGEYAMVGAGAVVTRDVPAHGLVYGNPAQLRGYVCKCGAPLPKRRNRGVVTCPECGEKVDLGG